MQIWYFHGQYKASGLETNKVSSNIFDLRHVSKVATQFEKKNKMFIYSFKYPNEESASLRAEKRGCRAAFRTLPNINNRAFPHNKCLIWS